jgi:hypothetical protein
MEGTGIYLIRGLDGTADLALVKDRSISFEMGKQQYIWRGYSPPFDQLPWRDETPADELSSWRRQPR